MRRLATLPCMLVTALIFTLAAGAPEGKVYGKGVAEGQTVAVSELVAHPDAYVGKVVRVEGLVTDVCPKRGCWMTLAGDQEFQTIRIKVDDGVIVFPMDAKGKHAVAVGVFTKIDLTPEQALEHARHLAEEKGARFDAAGARDLPTAIYQINGTGAVLR